MGICKTITIPLCQYTGIHTIIKTFRNKRTFCPLYQYTGILSYDILIVTIIYDKDNQCGAAFSCHILIYII